jgi:hypothetical protein
VARRLGVAETSVRRLEGTWLHPTHRGRFVFFDEREVENYAADHAARRNGRDQGEVAARAFELFRAGHDFRDVVIELRQTPERVRQLFREYALGSDLLVPASIRREIEELGLIAEGRAICADDILALLRRLTEGNGRLVQETIDQWQRIQQLERALERARSNAAVSNVIDEEARPMGADNPRPPSTEQAASDAAEPDSA